MKKTVFLWIIIGLLLALNSIVLYRYYHSQEKLQEISYQMNELSIKELRESFILKQAMMFQQMSEAVSCKDVKLQDAKTRKTIALFSLFKGNNALLFFRFKENDCDACVEKSVKLLEKMSGYFPANGIVILSGYGNVRQFYAYAQSKKKQFRILNTETFPVAAENQEQPYFFVVTPDLKIQNVFIVNKGDSQFTGDYLHNIEHKYWDLQDGHTHE
jgi:hypothetical protein